jgi:hypothetical protein
MKEHGMSGECSTHAELRNRYKVLLESLQGRHHSEDLVVDGSIISKCILRE